MFWLHCEARKKPFFLSSLVRSSGLNKQKQNLRVCTQIFAHALAQLEDPCRAPYVAMHQEILVRNIKWQLKVELSARLSIKQKKYRYAHKPSIGQRIWRFRNINGCERSNKSALRPHLTWRSAAVDETRSQLIPLITEAFLQFPRKQASARGTPHLAAWQNGQNFKYESAAIPAARNAIY